MRCPVCPFEAGDEADSWAVLGVHLKVWAPLDDAHEKEMKTWA